MLAFTMHMMECSVSVSGYHGTGRGGGWGVRWGGEGETIAEASLLIARGGLPVPRAVQVWGSAVVSTDIRPWS